MKSDEGSTIQMKVRKKLSPNDVGMTRTHQAGLLIPKNPDILGVFPRLDLSKVNPDCVISLHVPSLEGWWPARFVFYNTKDHGIGTRSEYRLTRITSLLAEFQAKPGDSLTFAKSQDGHIEVEFDPDEVQAVPDGKEQRLKNGWTMIIDDYPAPSGPGSGR
jgi:Restriction endonuclease EcoRII, N-terminal